MEWDPATLVLEAFRFSTVNREADFYVASVLTSGSIPEPATLALVVLAMSLMAIFAGRRRGVGRSASVLSRWYRPAVS
jgi:PEP-CTERM motif